MTSFRKDMNNLKQLAKEKASKEEKKESQLANREIKRRMFAFIIK